MRRLIVPLLFGLLGAGILIWLGVWQVQRLVQKEAILADIDARIAAEPVDLPAQPDPQADKYLPVAVDGVLAGPELHVLVGVKDMGAGYRLIQPIDMDGRRIMVDRGFIPLNAKERARGVGPARLTGNLHWPDEVDSYTPEPDAQRGIWFARDVALMAEALESEPTLLVVRQQISGPDGAITPLPVDSSTIPNDHLQYAITWFSLAIIWLVMTSYLIWRMTWPLRRETKG